MPSQRSMSQSPTRMESDYSLVFDDSSSFTWQNAQIIHRSQTVDSRRRSKSDEAPELPEKRRNTPAKPVRQFAYGEDDTTKTVSPEPPAGMSKEPTQPPNASTNPFSPTSPYAGVGRNQSESDPFGELAEMAPETTETPSKEGGLAPTRSKFAGLHLGGSIEAADVPDDVYIAKASLSGYELESEADQWAQVNFQVVWALACYNCLCLGHRLRSCWCQWMMWLAGWQRLQASYCQWTHLSPCPRALKI